MIRSVIDPALVRSRNGETNIVAVGPENLSSLGQDLSPSTIQADDASGVAIAVTQSLRLGYRKFGFLNGPAVASNVRRRTAASSVAMTFHLRPSAIRRSAPSPFRMNGWASWRALCSSDSSLPAPWRRQ